MRLEALTLEHFKKGKRIIAPLIGLPGCKMCDIPVKIAQQNFLMHSIIIKHIVNEFQPDIVFPLMDLTVEANAMGRFTIFPKNDTATVPARKFDKKEIDIFKKIKICGDSRAVGYARTVENLKSELKKSTKIVSYVSGPFTVAGLIMGADNAAMATISDTDFLHDLTEIITVKIIEYADLFLKAGADAICILEPSGVMLGAKQFSDFSGDYVKKVVQKCNEADVDCIYHVCGNSKHLIEQMVKSGVNALSLDSGDYGINLENIIKIIPDDVVLLGNINPTGKILNSSADQVEKETREILESMDKYPNYILSTGCDLPYNTPVENIRAFIKTGREYKIKS